MNLPRNFLGESQARPLLHPLILVFIFFHFVLFQVVQISRIPSQAKPSQANCAHHRSPTYAFSTSRSTTLQCFPLTSSSGLLQGLPHQVDRATRAPPSSGTHHGPPRVDRATPNPEFLTIKVYDSPVLL